MIPPKGKRRRQPVTRPVEGRALERGLPRIKVFSAAFQRKLHERRDAAAALARQQAVDTALGQDGASPAGDAVAEAVSRVEAETIAAEMQAARQRIEPQQRPAAERAAERFEEDVGEGARRPAGDIVRWVAAKGGISLETLVSPSRKSEVVALRNEALAAVHMLRPDLSLTALGLLFCRNRTTVMHALRTAGVDAGKRAPTPSLPEELTKETRR